MSDKIRDITSAVSFGSEVTIYLMSGKEVKGTLVDAGLDWIQVGTRRIYEGLLGGWELIETTNSIPEQAVRASHHSRVSDNGQTQSDLASGSGRASSCSPAPGDSGASLMVNLASTATTSVPNALSPVVPSPVHVSPDQVDLLTGAAAADSALNPISFHRVELPNSSVAATEVFNQQISDELDALLLQVGPVAQYAKLDPPAFERALNTEGLSSLTVRELTEVRNEWVRAVNIYENAVKLQEFAKLRTALPILESLLPKTNRAECVVLNMCVLCLQLKQPKKALATAEKAIEDCQSLKLMSTAAFCALECDDIGKAIWWLAKLCSCDRPVINDNTYYTLLRLADEHTVFEAYDHMLDWVMGSTNSEKVAIYVLQAVAVLLAKRNNREDAIAVLELAKSNLSITEMRRALSTCISQSAGEGSKLWRSLVASIEKEYKERKEFEIEEAWKRREDELRDKAKSEPNGEIYAYLVDRMYGFLVDKEGNERQFHRRNVKSTDLLRALDSFRPGTRLRVSCTYEQGPEGKLRASNLYLMSKPSDLLQDAKQLAQRGQHSQAISQLKKLLELEPDNADALKLLESSRKLSTSMPKGDSTLAQAKRDHLEKNYERAEKLYLRAIAERGPQAEKAIKELASLYLQQGRPRLAIDLMKKNIANTTDRLAALNLLCNCYQQAGQHADAIGVLQEIKQMLPKEKATEIDKRISSSQYRLGKYDEAEQTLRSVLKRAPSDMVASRMLEALRTAKQAGRYENANAVFKSAVISMEMSQLLYGISPTLTVALERCKYEGLRKQDLAERNFSDRAVEFTEDAIKYLKGYIKSLGASRPRERAACYLTSARLLQDINSPNVAQFRSDLRQYCALMGDVMALEPNVHMDVVRSFYAEAFAFADDNQLGKQLTVKAAQYLLSYVCAREELLESHIPTLVQAVARVFETPAPPKKIWDGVLEIFLIDKSAAETLLPILFDHPQARRLSIQFLESIIGRSLEQSISLRDYGGVWEVARTARNREHEAISNSLAATSLEKLYMVEIDMLQTTLRENKRSWFFDLDARRMDTLVQLADYLEQYNRQTTYEERERHLAMALALAEKEISDISVNPTRLSFSTFSPLLQRLASCIKDASDDLFQRAIPKVTLGLAVDWTSASVDKDLMLQIIVYNSNESSPISYTELTLEEEKGLYYPTHETYTVQESIRGGERRIVPCHIRITERAIKERQITVSVSLSYVTRKNLRIEVEKQQLSLRLYDKAEFEKISNPYAPFAQGGPVKDPRMFVGRTDLISQIRDAISQATTKCFALYGQKRAGKSSVLLHLNASLQQESNRYICLTFSLGEIQFDFSVQKFVHRILTRLDQELAEARQHGIATPEFNVPPAAELTDPVTQFIDLIEEFLRRCQSFNEWRSRRIVVTIDEFTYLYTAIQKGEVNENFMKAWKAILEKGIMSVVVIGQDVMPKFKLSYQNELGSTQDKRLMYLSENDARKLIEDPIRKPDGESRYKERAVERILELTAGNPFYIQIICDRLVELMNLEGSVYATEVEVNQVVHTLFHGDSPLRYGNFENLVVAGDADLEAKSADAVLSLLKHIAECSRGRLCPEADALQCDIAGAKEILNDLVLRDVLDMPQPSFYRIKVGLFHEWLVAQGIGQGGTVNAV